jgi:hypothetical protein
MKAAYASNVKKFSDIPNIGPAMKRDFIILNIKKPKDLKDKDPLKLYKLTGAKQDLCVLDTFMAAVDFMNGAKARPWWGYTKKRKEMYEM